VNTGTCVVKKVENVNTGTCVVKKVENVNTGTCVVKKVENVNTGTCVVKKVENVNTGTCVVKNVENVVKPVTQLFYNKLFYIICNNKAGGSWKYITDITDHYNKNKYIYLCSENDFKLLHFVKDSYLIIQYFLFTSIKIDAVLQAIKKYNLKLIIPLHDFYWISDTINYSYKTETTNGYLKHVNVNNSIKELFSMATYIISPSQFVTDIYSRHFSNITTISHNDHTITDKIIVPTIYNNTINLGIFHDYSIYKGKELYEYLKLNKKKYNNYNIQYYIVGVNIPRYNNFEFYNHLKKYKINGLMFLNKWGETYCYTLSKALDSGLPIFYNNIGSFKERIPQKENYFINVDNEQNFYDFKNMEKLFDNFINYIILNNKDNYYIPDKNNIKYNDFYNQLFG
jgi:hypothetical protein